MIRTQPRPDCSPDDLAGPLREAYGLTGSFSPLPGERDRNYLLATEGGDRWVVKVSAPDEADETLAFECDLLDWLARHGSAPAPRLMRTSAGEPILRIPAEGGAPLRVRVLTCCPGQPLARARPRDAALLAAVGRTAATLARDLARAPLEPPARPGFIWALERAAEVVGAGAPFLDDPARRRLVEAAARDFEAVRETWSRLPRQLIHADLNDHNLLVGEPTPEGRPVTAVLDFGDAHEGPAVFDLAIAVAYAVLEQTDPLQAAAAVVAAYHEVRPLEEAEMEVVVPLARARLAASVCIAATRRQRTPTPDPYLLVSEEPAWEALERLGPLPRSFAAATIRSACGAPPCRRSPSLAAWLATAGAVPPVEPPPPGGTTVLDLSVASPLLTGSDTDDTAAFTRRVWGAMEAAGATVGIGRWGEPRAFYLTDAFAGHPADPPERRTVHLGVDLFAPAGTPVRAPLPATVVDVAVRPGRLDYGPVVVLEHAAPDGPFRTLFGHLDPDSVARLEGGRSLAAGEEFARIGAPPANGDWPPHLHLQIIADPLDLGAGFPGVCAPRERAVWLSLSPDPSPLLGGGVDAAYRPPPDLQERRRRLLGPSLSVSYRQPIHVVRGRGRHLFDVWGRPYLDCVNNVAHVGHEHPSVVEAGRRQMRVLNTNTRYLHEAVLDYAERLLALFPEPLEVCYFLNSGSEANELALRLARAWTGARGVVALEGGYHGHTQALVDVSHYKFSGPGGSGAPPWVRAAALPDEFRGRYRRGDPDRAARYASHVRAACKDLAATPHGVSAFLAESVPSCAGQIVLPPGYLEAAFAHARACGAVCIADEVQVGFGRVGTHWWGFETQGAVPDIVTLGKPIGNGHPLAAVVTTRAIADAFANGMEFFSTFGGNPVSARIGLAVLDVMEEEGLREHAEDVGRHLRSCLADVAGRHPVLGDVRGLGLFVGAEFVVGGGEAPVPAPAVARYVVERARERGVLLSTDGPDHNVIKIKPPLPFMRSDAERVASVVDEVLAEDAVALLAEEAQRSAPTA